MMDRRLRVYPSRMQMRMKWRLCVFGVVILLSACLSPANPSPQSESHTPRGTAKAATATLEPTHLPSNAPPGVAMTTTRIVDVSAITGAPKPNRLAAMRWVPQFSTEIKLQERDYGFYNQIVADPPDSLFFVPRESKDAWLQRYNIRTGELVSTTLIGESGIPTFPYGLMRTRDGQVWGIDAYDSGPQMLRQFDREKGEFRVVKDRDGLLEGSFAPGRGSICEGPDGKLYLVFDYKAYVFDPASMVARRIEGIATNNEPGIYPFVISVGCGVSALWLIVDAERGIARVQALARLDWIDAKIELFENPFPRKTVGTDLVPVDNTVWVAGGPGLIRVDIKEGRSTWTVIRAADAEFDPYSLDRTSDGLLWMAVTPSAVGGLRVYDPSDGSWRTFPGIFSTVGEMPDGSVWAATPRQIYKLDRGVK